MPGISIILRTTPAPLALFAPPARSKASQAVAQRLVLSVLPPACARLFVCTRHAPTAPRFVAMCVQEAAAQGLVAAAGASVPGGDGGGAGGERSSAELEGSSLPDSEVQHLRVVHHLR